MNSILGTNIFGLFSFVGIVYFVILFLVSLSKGVVWTFVMAIVLFICLHIGLDVLGELDGVYWVNGPNGVPCWIFNPESLIVVPILVVCIRFAYRVVEGLHGDS
jgi:hypothetical protein